MFKFKEYKRMSWIAGWTISSTTALMHVISEQAWNSDWIACITTEWHIWAWFNWTRHGPSSAYETRNLSALSMAVNAENFWFSYHICAIWLAECWEFPVLFFIDFCWSNLHRVSVALCFRWLFRRVVPWSPVRQKALPCYGHLCAIWYGDCVPFGMVTHRTRHFCASMAQSGAGGCAMKRLPPI